MWGVVKATLFQIFLTISKMPDDAEAAAKTAAKAKVEELSNNFDEGLDDSDDSQEDSDDSTDSKAQDSGSDSDDSDADNADDDSDDDKSDEDDDSKEDDSSDDDDVNFDFREMPTHVAGFVGKLEKMTDEERRNRVASLDPVRNAPEIRAAKEKYPESFEKKVEGVTISAEEWANVQEKISLLGDADKAAETLKTLEELTKRQPALESQLVDRLLKDKYGSRSEEVEKDPAFSAAMKSLSKLDLVDRLAQASMHSKVARDILIEQKATELNRNKALAKRKKGAQHSKPKGGYKHSIMTAEGIQERFAEQLAKAE